MPMIEVTLLAGRTDNELTELHRGLCDAAVQILGTSPDRVRIIIREVERSRWSVGGTPL